MVTWPNGYEGLKNLTFDLQVDMILLDPQVIGGDAGVLPTV